MRPDGRATGAPARWLRRPWTPGGTAERNYVALTPTSEGYCAAGVAVVSAWMAYQKHIAPDSTEVIFVTDNERRYVAVSSNVSDLLGYEPNHLLGRKVEDFAAPELAPVTAALWEGFLHAQREASIFSLVAMDGAVIDVAYEARADFPVPDFHVSRLRSIGAAGSGSQAGSGAGDDIQSRDRAQTAAARPIS